MRTLFGDFITQLKGIWSRLDGGQRLVVASVLLATVAGLGAIVWFAGQPSYVAVFTATTGEDLATARRALEQGNIAYVVDDSGMTFLVDRDRVGAAKGAVNEAGLMPNESGSAGIGVSSIIDDAETKAWKLVNASIAKAESAVRAIAGVANARITASPPRRTRAFVDKDRESRPSAAVLVGLRPGATFTDVARTAASLTAAQLGIPVENITVANAAGGQRWRHDPDREAGGASSEFIGLQRGMSSERTLRAQELLDQMWPHKTSVAVNVELDPAWEIVSQKMLPETELLRSEKMTKETSDTNSGGSTTQGPSTVAADASRSKSETRNETRDREFVTEIGERRSGRLAPEIKRLTVAVLYDRSLEETEGFDKQELANAVKAMVGWDKSRDPDDGFSVLPGDFVPAETVAVTTSGGDAFELALRWGPTVGQILGVLVVVLFLRGLFKRSGRRAAAAAPLAAAADDEPSPEEAERRMRREIEKAIANDPAALAKLLENWLIEQGA